MARRAVRHSVPLLRNALPGVSITKHWTPRGAAALALLILFLLAAAVPATAADLITASQLEAPMLAKLVAEGKLPPLRDRLPENPIVVPVVERPGQYGGTWHEYHVNADLATIRLIQNYTPLVRWKSDLSDIVPGLAESWESSPDGKKSTYHLRRGIKWSDGVPFTARDIAFWWELCNDKRVAFPPPEWAYVGGKKMRITAPDDYTVVFEYDAPFYLLPMYLSAGFWNSEQMLAPFHYLKQFHPDHNPAYTDFKELLRKNAVQDNPDRPTLSAWKLTYYSPTGDRVVFERNPYFWGVDPLGRQLPYIDRVESVMVQSPEAGVLLIIAGNVDAQFRLIALADYPLLRRFAVKAGYRILRYEAGTAAWHAISVNWDVQDPRKRRLFRDKRFRRGLALAIDREKINQVVWDGLGRPQAAAITDEAWHFRSPEGQEVLKRWTTEWAPFDPPRANALLDEAGMTQRDAEGFRMFEGQPLSVVIDAWDEDAAAREAQLIVQDWARVGIHAKYKRCVGTDLLTRMHSGRFDMYTQHNSEMDLFSYPGHVFPTTDMNWHPLVGKYYMTGGKEGEAPEGPMVRLLDIFEQCRREPDLARRHSLVLDAIRVHFEEGPFMLGTCGRQPEMVTVKNNFRNVPPTGVLGPWAVSQPGSQWPEQFFIDTETTPTSVGKVGGQ
jgi:peptide/nickel transport system substrate-binding protein